MNFDKIIARAKAILLTPKTEWPVIAAEQTTVADLYKNYIVILAAIPAVAGFIKSSLIGYSAYGVSVRIPIGSGLAAAVVGYVLTLALVYVMSLIIDALAPTFGGEKNPVQALKVVGYSYTASWLANAGVILPWIGFLIALAGAIYAIYLLYLGLPSTMKAPQEKAVGYTVVSILAALVLGWILSLVITGIVGTNAMMGAAISGSGGQASVDSNSALGKLDAWSKNVEAAGKQLEAAQKSGDAAAQSKALGAVLGAAAGGQQVEALAPDVLKPFVPETLAGLPRTDFSAERNGALGMQVSEARATYTDNGDRRIELEVVDMGAAKGLMSLASWATVENQRETEHGYEKTYQQGGRLVHEQWDGQDKHGEYAVIVGDRFSVKASGRADSIDQLKAAVAAINLSGLEALKNQGVKNG